jgi:hypothetical protein
MYRICIQTGRSGALATELFGTSSFIELMLSGPQAPFWLKPPSPEINHSNSKTHEKKKKKTRDSETVRAKHRQTSRPFQIGRRNLALQSTTSTRVDSVSPTTTSFLNIQTRSPSPEDSPPKYSTSEGASIPISLESTQESDEGATNILRMQRPPKKGRPQTAPERHIMPAFFQTEHKGFCDQENSRPNTASNASCRSAALNVPSWDRDWVRKHLTPPGMIDPPREAVSAEPPKMFTNELYEVEEQESTPTNSVCLTNMSSMKKEKELGQIINFSSPRNTPRRSSAERANNKRKIPDSHRRRSRRPSRTSRKSPPPNQTARAKYLTWDVRNQKKTKPSLQNVTEEQSSALMSSEDIKKEVEWHKFVTEMTETLLMLRGMHDVASDHKCMQVICKCTKSCEPDCFVFGVSFSDGLDRLIGPTEDDDVLSVAQQCASKLTGRPGGGYPPR